MCFFFLAFLAIQFLSRFLKEKTCGFEQISSVRDILKSSVDDISRNSGGRRLLRLCLTDGHSEITAIEYSHVPSIPDNVVPGSKVMPFLLLCCVFCMITSL